MRLLLPYAAVKDIMHVRARFPENGRVALRTSLILADYAKYDATYRDDTLDALRVARLAGNHPHLSLKYGNFRWLYDDPEYLQIIDLEPISVPDVFDASMDPLEEQIAAGL